MISDKVPMTLDQLKAFLWAGKADITVKNVNTGNVEEYLVKLMPNDRGFFISVRKPGGIFGGKCWDYMGIVWCNTNVFIATSRSKVLASDRSFQVFKWILDVLKANCEFPDNIVFTHNDRCGRCGRRLKDPESIKFGLGPHCRKLLSAG